jgi:peptidyl-dipeptidase Dcp
MQEKVIMQQNSIKKTMNNILVSPFQTPFSSVPFQQITDADYEPAIRICLAQAQEAVNAIANNSEEVTFNNTVVALERTGQQLNRVTEAFFNITSAETNDYLESIQEKISPLLAAYSNDIMLNDKLFEKVKQVYEQSSRNTLDQEDIYLLEKTYSSFKRNGALLNDQDKATLRSIDQELSSLKVKFSQNVLQETNAFELHLTEHQDVAGLPTSVLQQAAALATSKKLPGWIFTLQYPSFVPFMTYASNRSLREKMYIANGTKAYKHNEHNNEQIIKDIVRLRHTRAQLLGFNSHAAFVLEERMAKTDTTVNTFLNDLLDRATPYAQKDVAALLPLAQKDGIEKMMPYDHAYYAEQLREQAYQYSEEEMKPYFSLDKVRDAAFKAAENLYGLQFVKNNDVAVYHEEVTVYEVLEEGKKHKALLYCDWHPRAGKRAGAWMTSFKGQYIEDGENHRPHISIVCNFSRPHDNVPSLLTFNEVTTLFHEFGHALHGILANTKYESLSGTNVYWDFVELPSQFMENYCYQKSFLSSFAQHYATGETLPMAQIDKLVAASNFMEGYQTLRQLSFGILDMAYHTNALQPDNDIETFEKTITQKTQLYPSITGVAQSPSFSHIFSGGYAAGYYSYKWSEVLDADAFEYFKETGIFNSETAAKFKTLLSSGGTVDPMQLYINFRGRAPQVDALLQRAGLTEK